MRTAISDSNVNNKAEGKAVYSQNRDDLKAANHKHFSATMQ